MKIMPTKNQFLVLRDAAKGLGRLCKHNCEECFMDKRLSGESCCPVAHIMTITEDLTEDLLEKAISGLPDSSSEKGGGETK